MNNNTRCIVHLDLDCFYAQVEIVHNPTLKNLPVGILQNQTISTCNYVARQYGIQKMTHRTKAIQQCPQLVIVNARMDLYRETSRKIFVEYLMKCVPQMEQAGIDEAYFDVTQQVKERIESGNVKDWKICGEMVMVKEVEFDAEDKMLIVASQIAEEMREDLYLQFGYTCSGGIAHNKMLAKLASQVKKPNGQAIILKRVVEKVLCPLPVRKIPKVGRQMAEKLATIGVSKVVDVLQVEKSKLVQCVGEKMATHIIQAAQGIDNSPVVVKGPVKSIGTELTFIPVDSYEKVAEKFKVMSNDLAARVIRDTKRHDRRPKQLVLRWALNNYDSKFSSTSVPYDFAGETVEKMAQGIQKCALSMLKSHLKPPFKVFRLSLTASNFENIKKGASILNFLKPKQNPTPQVEPTIVESAFAELKEENKKRKREEEDFQLALKLQKQENDPSFRLQEKLKKLKQTPKRGKLYNYFKPTSKKLSQK